MNKTNYSLKSGQISHISIFFLKQKLGILHNFLFIIYIYLKYINEWYIFLKILKYIFFEIRRKNINFVFYFNFFNLIHWTLYYRLQRRQISCYHENLFVSFELIDINTPNKNVPMEAYLTSNKCCFADTQINAKNCLKVRR